MRCGSSGGFVDGVAEVENERVDDGVVVARRTGGAGLDAVAFLLAGNCGCYGICAGRQVDCADSVGNALCGGPGCTGADAIDGHGDVRD